VEGEGYLVRRGRPGWPSADVTPVPVPVTRACPTGFLGSGVPLSERERERGSQPSTVHRTVPVPDALRVLADRAVRREVPAWRDIGSPPRSTPGGRRKLLGCWWPRWYDGSRRGACSGRRVLHEADPMPRSRVASPPAKTHVADRVDHWRRAPGRRSRASTGLCDPVASRSSTGRGHPEDEDVVVPHALRISMLAAVEVRWSSAVERQLHVPCPRPPCRRSRSARRCPAAVMISPAR